VSNEALLRVEGLRKYFPLTSGSLFQRGQGQVKAVDDISFSVRAGETLGLVGETGCGKSTTARLLARHLTPTSGQITFEDHDFAKLSKAGIAELHRNVQMVFQDPFSSLNPRQTVGTIIAAPFRIQRATPPGGIKAAVQELLELVGLSPEHYNRFPQEFSGGQRQRICIARAVALRPKLIVADEPVSALDVSIQAQIINLLEDLQAELQLTYVFIAHDLSVVRHISDRVAVMYLGKIVEIGDRDDVYETPRHPYTRALLSAAPIPERRRDTPRGVGRIRLAGDVPSPINPPPGCSFHTRCWKAQEICRSVEPPLTTKSGTQSAACHFPENVSSPSEASV
jgi:peptide/nickel transport system ATP-binding protein/oligopeptide transport system ATP-binding protein